MDADRLERALEQLVGDAVLSPEQAGAVRAALAEAPPSPPSPPTPPSRPSSLPASESDAPPGRGIPPAAEAAAWVGAVLATAAGFTVVGSFWNELQRWAQTGILLLAAAALLAAGAAVQADRRPGARRIVSVVWFLAIVAVGAAALVGTSRDAARMRGWPWVLAGVIATAVAAPLWRRHPRSLQLLALTGSVLATLLAVLSLPERVPHEWFGLVVWALGAALILLAWGGLAVPVSGGLGIGGVLALAGPQMLIFTFDRGGVVLALCTVAGLFAIGGALRHVPLTALAAVGLAVFVPQALDAYFPGSLNASATLFVSGTALLASALAVIRRARDRDEDDEAETAAETRAGEAS